MATHGDREDSEETRDNVYSHPVIWEAVVLFKACRHTAMHNWPRLLRAKQVGNGCLKGRTNVI